MNDKKSLEMFSEAPVHKAVLNNALPAMLAMLMVLVYNLADTFFIGLINMQENFIEIFPKLREKLDKTVGKSKIE